EPTSNDELGRRAFAQALAERMDSLREGEGKDGFAVHLHAPWGAGKTSILYMMDDHLRSSKRAGDERWITVHFSAWKHQRRNPPWWPLIRDVLSNCFQSSWNQGNLRTYFTLWIYWLWWKLKSDWFPYVLCVLALVLIPILLAPSPSLAPRISAPNSGAA